MSEECYGNPLNIVRGHDRGLYKFPSVGIKKFFDYIPMWWFYKAYTGRYQVRTIPVERFTPDFLRSIGYDELHCADACMILKWCKCGVYYPFLLTDEETQRASIHVLREFPGNLDHSWEHLLIVSVNGSVIYVDKKYPWMQVEFFFELLSYYQKGTFREGTQHWVKNGLVEAVEFAIEDDVLPSFCDGSAFFLP